MRAFLYDRALVALTSGWYAAVLGRLPARTRLLDVGVGTAGALVSQAEVLRTRDLHVTGIDIDADYVKRAQVRVVRADLLDRVDVLHEPLQAHRGGPYDAVYFAASFMLFDDPVGALQDAQRLLAPGGRVWFTQTFQDRPSRFVEKLKPALKHWTSIDFGRVTYEQDFLDVLEAAGLEVETHEVIGRSSGRSSRVVGARPRAQVGEA